MSSKTNKSIGLTFSLKLSISYAVFFVFSSLALFLVAYYLINGLVGEKEREVIRDRIQEYTAWYYEGGVDAVRSRFAVQSRGSDDILFIRIIGPLDQVLFISFPPGAEGFDPHRFKAPEPGQKGPLFFVEDNGKGTWTIGNSRLPGGLILQVGKNSTRSQEFLSYFRSVFLKIVLPLLLLGFIGGGFLTFRAMRPVRQLIQTVRRILETGDTSRRVPARSGRGELDELVSLFNQMLDKNDSLIQAMRESLDNVSHDLRTPMTRLRGTAELAFQKNQDSGPCREALADCMEESDRVLTMLNTLMDVAEAETGAMHLNKTEVSVPEIVHSVVDLYEIIAEERKITIRTRLPEELLIHADRNRILQVTANLLDNAIKYSRPGGSIDISTHEDGPFAVIVVADQGVGIAPEEINQIWDRLYRGDRSRSKRGLGLGLSLVRAIVEAHGGKVRVESRLDQGATFTAMLPRKNSSLR
jgi:signal transduction histidine kinase